MNLGNRYSQHSFAQVPQANIQRSQFDQSTAKEFKGILDSKEPENFGVKLSPESYRDWETCFPAPSIVTGKLRDWETCSPATIS